MQLRPPLHQSVCVTPERFPRLAFPVPKLTVMAIPDTPDETPPESLLRFSLARLKPAPLVLR
ncbi:MAG: hypothetical protein KA271_01600 [Propionivibrio sp.]|jgi:hypothetical protein|nr:hypothetical protein [Propionivibrio sp.]